MAENKLLLVVSYYDENNSQITFSKKETSMIAFSDGEQVGVRFLLDNLPLNTCEIRVAARIVSPFSSIEVGPDSLMHDLDTVPDH